MGYSNGGTRDSGTDMNLRRNALRRVGLVITVAVGAALAAPTPQAQAAPAADVIVRGPGAKAAVAAARGTVTFDLPIVDGVAAQVPAAALARLRAQGLDVTENSKVTVHGSISNKESTIKPVTLAEVGADKLHAIGIDGRETSTVALIDTGVTTAGIPDLAGRLVPVVDEATKSVTSAKPCLDLSGEDSCDDTYGHGTFLAALIAGNGAASGGAYKGVAPGTRIVSIKIAGRDGSSDVSKVLAAIQWVVSFKDAYGIKVLNLSLGTDSRQPYQIDPLNLAVERAWDAGVAAIVAAGNKGPAYGTVTKPGDDPLVITVGATEDRETPAVDDDRVPLFSGRGDAWLPNKPDVVAPGTRLVSVLAPGSTIEGVLKAQGSKAVSGYYRRASGTSMSAAVVSGVAALLADARPEWTPGQMKSALLSTARKVSLTDPWVVGRGMVDAYGASRVPAPGDANAGVPRSDGSGLLHASRGSLIVKAVCDETRQKIDKQCDQEITGDTTAQGRDYDQDDYAGTWSGTSWYRSQWTGTSWYGTSWYGTSWYGTSWYSMEASQGTAWDGNIDATTVHGAAPPGSGTYGLWR